MSLVFTDLYIYNKCCTIPLSYLKFKLPELKKPGHFCIIGLEGLKSQFHWKSMQNEAMTY